MSVVESSPSILEDVEFIQKNYTSYFHSLVIEEKTADRVVFDVIPITAIERYLLLT